MANIVNQYCTNGIVELTHGNCLTNSTRNENTNNNTNNKNNQEETLTTKVIKNSRQLNFDALIKVSNTSFKKSLLSTHNTVSNLAQRVRVDAKNRTLDEFIDIIKPTDVCSSVTIQSNTQLISIETSIPTLESLMQSNLISRKFEFDSLNVLRREICKENDAELMSIFKRHYFVGFYENSFGIFQVESEVYIIRLKEVIKEFFYQIIIFSFGNMGSYRIRFSDENNITQTESNIENLSEMFRVEELLSLYYDTNEIKKSNDSLNKMLNTLASLSSLLWDYFSIDIVGDEVFSNEEEKTKIVLYLRSIPSVINGYVPPLEALPELIYDLGNLNFEEEQICFKEIAIALAKFFTPFLSNFDYQSNDITSDVFNNLEFIKSSLKRFIFPALKSKFLPPTRLRDCFQKITSIEQAFKKFGRC